MKKSTIIFLILIIGFMLCGGAALWLYKSYRITNPLSCKTIGSIPTPLGYHRMEVKDGSFGAYLRALPLRGRGTKVMLYGGKNDANYQMLAYAVIDMNVLSNSEQCADAAMRLRAEYLYSQKRYKEIVFTNVNGKKMAYKGGESRSKFDKYLNNVFGECSTYSMSQSMDVRQLSDIQVGDVFVYKARPGRKYGHACIVVDVAENRFGEKVFMLAEGNTPARDKHIVRNLLNPLMSPWFTLGETLESDELVTRAPFHFYAKDLRHF